MSMRYSTGLIYAYLVFGLVCALGVVPLVVAKGQSQRTLEFIQLWVWFGVPTVLVLATIVGPAILGVDGLLSDRLPPVVAAAIGAAVGPLLLPADASRSGAPEWKCAARRKESKAHGRST